MTSGGRKGADEDGRMRCDSHPTITAAAAAPTEIPAMRFVRSELQSIGKSSVSRMKEREAARAKERRNRSNSPRRTQHDRVIHIQLRPVRIGDHQRMLAILFVP